MDVRTIFIGAGKQLVDVMAWGRWQARHSVTKRALHAHPWLQLLMRCTQCKVSVRIELRRALGGTLTIRALWQGGVIQACLHQCVERSRTSFPEDCMI